MKLEDSNIQYTRVLMLPLSYPSLPEHGYNFTDFTSKEKTRMSEHLNEFSRNHLIKVNELRNKFRDRFIIKIQPFAMVNYSYAMIDKQKVLLELDKYSFEGHSLPDNILEITDVYNGKIVSTFQKLSKSYMKHSFDFEIERDLNRMIGEIKDKEIELKLNNRS